MGRRVVAVVAGLLGALAIATPGADAAEIHTLFDDACARTSGLMVHVSTREVTLVDLTGALVTWPRDRVAAVVVHKTLENPLPSIDVTPAMRAHLRDVWVGDDDGARPTFTGWPTAFFDDLVLYVDLDGQTHVLEAEELRRIRGALLPAGRVAPKTFAPVALAFPAELVPCGNAGAPADAVLPSRVVADRIKVGDYLVRLEERYLAQDGFEERTLVYARPFLFEQESRLGLIYDPQNPIRFPIYMRWSSGRPYRFQSQNVIGMSAHEVLPTALPTLSARSDVKSHFFSATFVGHLLALPAGSNAYRFFEPPELRAGDAARIERSYNYVLLMGADWWRLSAGAGVSYLAARVNVPEHAPRTLLGGSMSPTVRLRYLAPTLDVRALYFRSRSSGSLADAFLEDDEPEPPPELDYTWSVDTVRLGATWRPWSTVSVTLDQLASFASYADALPTMPVVLDTWEATTRAELAVTFGRYVTVRAHGRLGVAHVDASRPALAATTTTDLELGGALEFVF